MSIMITYNIPPRAALPLGLLTLVLANDRVSSSLINIDLYPCIEAQSSP